MRFIRELRDKGFTVVTFDGYHHRVNGEFDFWLNDHGNPISWHDRYAGDRGKRRPNEMAQFITQRIADRPPEASREQFIERLVEIGWTAEEAVKEWNDRSSKASCSGRLVTTPQNRTSR